MTKPSDQLMQSIEPVNEYYFFLITWTWCAAIPWPFEDGSRKDKLVGYVSTYQNILGHDWLVLIVL